MHVLIEQAEELGLEISGSSLQYYAGLSTVATVCNGAWHHLVWTRSGTTLSVYVDGALDKAKRKYGWS